MLRSSILLLILFSTYTCTSQTVSGSWYGKADVNARGNNSNYLTELILKQKGNKVEGVFGYYFKDSYQSFFIRGTYDSKTRVVQINNIPILFYKAATRDGIECPMSFQAILRVSKVNSSLNGSFYTDDKYKYTCPEIRVSYKMDPISTNQDSALKNTLTGKKLWQPQEEDFVVSSPSPVPVVHDSADVPAAIPATDIPPVIDEEKKLIEKFETRKKVFKKDLLIESDSIRISFYDNGDVDGDSISVFLNNNPVITRQELSSRAMNIYLALDSTREINELSMFAENLGKLPPNTALMVITDGINRYEVYLSSSFSQNASVRLRRKDRK